MNKFITVCFLIISNCLLSQSIDTIWYNNKWEITNKSNGYYYRIANYDEVKKLYLVTDYFPNGNTQMTGTYSSLESEIKEGLFIWYFENGNKDTESEYSMGVLLRTKKWDINGKLRFETRSALFPGGVGKLLDFISDNTNYPKKARKNDISGIVMVEFLIDTNGKVDSVRISKSIHPLLDNEALRVVKSMPDWLPAETDGEKLKLHYKLPISFKLED